MRFTYVFPILLLTIVFCLEVSIMPEKVYSFQKLEKANKKTSPGYACVATHTFNPSIWGAVTGRSLYGQCGLHRVSVQLELHGEVLC